MKAVFLGVGEAFDENYPNNSVLVLSGKTNLLIDCGDSPVRQLWKFSQDPDLIDALYITHRHSDHLFGLPALLSRMLEDKRKKPLTIITQKQIIEDIANIANYAYQGLKSNFGFKINFIEVKEGDAIKFNELALSFALSDHTQPNLAIKISNVNEIVCYSGDGIINDFSFYKDSDLLIHEAYTYDKDIPGHVKIKSLIENAKDNNIKCLALVHMQRNFRRNEFPDLKSEILKENLKILLPEPLDEHELG